MPRIRKTVQREILEILDNSIFTSADFEVEFGDSSDNEPIVRITFAHSPEYLYEIYFHNNGKIFTFQRPGRFEEEEEDERESFIDAKINIHDWCRELKAELKASSPIYENAEELKFAIENQININPSREEFTIEEINILQHKFSQMEERMAALEKENIITSSQLEEMKAAIHSVSEGLEYYPKKTWVKTASNKLVNLAKGIGKSPEGRKLLSDGVRKLLGLE